MSKEFDLSKYETVDTATLTVQNPKGGELIGADGVNPVIINLYGMGSKQYVNAKYKLDNANQVRSIAMLRNNKPPKPEDVAKDEAEFLAAVTQSIENFPIEPIALYSNPKLGYIKAQVDKFVGDTENFIQF